MNTYFVTRDDKLFLKPEYAIGSEPNLPQGLLAALEKSFKSFDQFNELHGAFFTQTINA